MLTAISFFRRILTRQTGFALVLFSSTSAWLGLQAQSAKALPGCATSPAVQRTLDDQLGPQVIDRIKYPERYQLQVRVLHQLIAQHPREYGLYQSLWWATLFGADRRDGDELRAEWVQRAKDHADDPLALMLAALALEGKDTPERIRLLESARALAPQFPAPALELADIYRDGKYADAAKSKAETEAFFALCPAYAPTDFMPQMKAQWLLRQDPALLPTVSAALRASLAKEKDAKRLEEFSVVWSREFSYRPPAEHDAERVQIAEDLSRLEKVHSRGDAAWEAFLIDGYRRRGASGEAVKAREDRLIQDFPHSTQAERIVRKRWYNHHPAPEDQSDVVAWAKYDREQENAIRGWVLEYPDDTFLGRSELFGVVQDDPGVSEPDGLAALDQYLQAIEDYKGAGMMNYGAASAPEFLVKHGWQPDRAMDLLEKTPAIEGNGHTKATFPDDASDADLKRFQWGLDAEDQHTVSVFLLAAIQAGKPEAAMKLQAAIEAPPPTDKRLLADYWINRARFSSLQKHDLDALTFYRKAMDSRAEPWKPYHGQAEDEWKAEARALWKDQGGAETSWAMWLRALSGADEELAKTPWKKADEAMPDFTLSDFSGKTWRLKDFRGKTVLITSWATWCHPCNQELMHLEKFYESVKDRPDLQVLTLNIDQDPGDVAPFMREHGYQFPVLSAVTMEAANDFVPRVWIVDAQGKWRWVLNGFDEETDAEFSQQMLNEIAAVKGGQ